MTSSFHLVVVSPCMTNLFILTRDIEYFNINYKDEVLAYVESKGFIFMFNIPLETYQGSDCQYSVNEHV